VSIVCCQQDGRTATSSNFHFGRINAEFATIELARFQTSAVPASVVSGARPRSGVRAASYGSALLGAALAYLQTLGLPAIAACAQDLLNYAEADLANVKGRRLIETARETARVTSFTVKGRENEAVAHHFDAHGIAVRSSHL
jgi:selenocysteine lyase/cysteine desulfurase